jgi:outer membrane protein OmpA-like peptidoglycan-associated protein
MVTPRLVNVLSARSGLPDANIRSGISVGTGKIVNRLVDKARDGRAMDDAIRLIDQTPDVDDPTRLVDSDTFRRSGNELLGLVTDERTGVIDRMGSSLGISDSAASGLLSVAAGVVIGGLRKFSRSLGGIDASTLSRVLIQEEQSLRTVMPVSAGEVVHREPYMRGREAIRERRQIERGGRGKWLWLLALIPLVLIGLWFMQRPKERVDEAYEPSPLVKERVFKPLTIEPSTTSPAPAAPSPEVVTPPEQLTMREQTVPEPSAQPTTPTDAAQPITPTEGAQPMTPTEGAQANTPTEGAGPAQPMTPTEGAHANTPTEGAEPAQPATPSAEPAQPATPSDESQGSARIDESPTEKPLPPPTAPAAEPPTAQSGQPSAEPSTPQPAEPTMPSDESATEKPAMPSAASTEKLDFVAGSAEQQLLTEVQSGTEQGKSEWLTLDDAKFATGSADVPAEATEQIGHVAQILEENPHVKLEIGGYTSSTGSAALNKKLSQQRANAVKDALVEKGIDASRLKAKGYGEKNPVEASDSETDANRRVAVRIVAK